MVSLSNEIKQNFKETLNSTVLCGSLLLGSLLAGYVAYDTFGNDSFVKVSANDNIMYQVKSNMAENFKDESINIKSNLNGYEVASNEKGQTELIVRINKEYDGYYTLTNVYDKNDSSLTVDSELIEGYNKQDVLIATVDNNGNGDNVIKIKKFEGNSYGNGIIVDKQRVNNYSY